MTPEQTTIRARWQAEFDDGARCAYFNKFQGEREPGGYPRGFHRWPQARRDAWFSGYNRGFHDRLSVAEKEAR